MFSFFFYYWTTKLNSFSLKGTTFLCKSATKEHSVSYTFTHHHKKQMFLMGPSCFHVAYYWHISLLGKIKQFLYLRFSNFNKKPTVWFTVLILQSQPFISQHALLGLAVLLVKRIWVTIRQVWIWQFLLLIEREKKRNLGGLFDFDFWIKILLFLSMSSVFFRLGSSTFIGGLFSN